MIREARGENFKGKTVAISGAGNVAQVRDCVPSFSHKPILIYSLVIQYAALKVIELGGTVLSLSDSKGSLVSVDGTGLTVETIALVATLKLKGGYLPDLGDVAGFKWVAGEVSSHRSARSITLIDYSLFQEDDLGLTSSRSMLRFLARRKTKFQVKKPTSSSPLDADSSLKEVTWLVYRRPCLSSLRVLT
jgi:hypothetical protein